MRRRLWLRALWATVPLLVLAACTSSGRGAAISTTTASTAATTSTTAPAVSTTTTLTTPPAVAGDAAGLAAQATEAERAVHDPAVSGQPLAARAWEQQAVSRALARQPSLLPAVLARVPADVRPAVEANAQAAIELLALTTPHTDLPPWRIVPAAAPDVLLTDYHDASAAIGVPWQYLAAINFVETKFGRVRGTSTAGAEGPMQFKPATWQRYGNGGDINSDRDAIFAAARLLRADGFPGDVDGALYHYNPSRHYVAAVKLYAGRMAADASAFRGYYEWQVYYHMTTGDRVLLVGYPDVAPIPG